VHEKQHFPLQLPPLFILVGRSPAFCQVLYIVLDPLDSIFQIIDILLQLLIFLRLAHVVVGGLVEHGGSVGELALDIVYIGTGVLSSVADRLAVKVSGGRFVAGWAGVVVLVGSGISGAAGGDCVARAVGGGRGVGPVGGFVLEQILHEANGRVDIAHRGGDKFLG